MTEFKEAHEELNDLLSKLIVKIIISEAQNALFTLEPALARPEYRKRDFSKDPVFDSDEERVAYYNSKLEPVDVGSSDFMYQFMPTTTKIITELPEQHTFDFVRSLVRVAFVGGAHWQRERLAAITTANAQPASSPVETPAKDVDEATSL